VNSINRLETLKPWAECAHSLSEYPGATRETECPRWAVSWKERIRLLDCGFLKSLIKQENCDRWMDKKETYSGTDWKYTTDWNRVDILSSVWRASEATSLSHMSLRNTPGRFLPSGWNISG